jgi:hypothetical protein
VWPNGRASVSGAEGCGFESRHSRFEAASLFRVEEGPWHGVWDSFAHLSLSQPPPPFPVNLILVPRIHSASIDKLCSSSTTVFFRFCFHSTSPSLGVHDTSIVKTNAPIDSRRLAIKNLSTYQSRRMHTIVAAWHDGVSLWTMFCGIPTSLATYSLSLLAGLTLLSMAIYFTPSSETSFSKPSPALKRFSYDRTPLTYIRNAILGTTSTIFFLDTVLARHGVSKVPFEVGEATIGMYGIFRVWETCFAGMIDGIGLPYWEGLPRAGGGTERTWQDGSSTRLKGGSTSSHRQDRAKYTFDLLTSVRGVSWISDRKFSSFLKN